MNNVKVLGVAVVLLACCVASAADRVETLDGFLNNAARVKDLKVFCLVFASQTDPAQADRNAAEVRRSFWAAQPEAKLTDSEREIELTRFDTDWRRVADVIKERNMTTVYFCGIDNVMPVRKSQYWY